MIKTRTNASGGQRKLASTNTEAVLNVQFCIYKLLF